MKSQIIITADGSHTLHIPELNECYHSRNGAIAESKHIFIDAGYRFLSWNKEHLNILEVGYGTGLNAFLTLIECEKDEKKVNYVAVEPYRIEEKILSKLNYPDITGSGHHKMFAELHQSVSGVINQLSGNFEIVLIERKIEETQLQDNGYDLVYFDAFAPDVQPEMWTPEIFNKLYIAMKDGGILVTYSCKGDVKRALKSAGFTIEKLPGPLGKREFLRAKK
ncbi:MAG: tRNA (5-methylaminomethyl-2-thiouridine)(34)-methyltransferase MnmD [Bacteroidales bacterium]|jgi:tRNA U34 5-methylaminomethyl-2-thiouridine-forming methyltransferase MnmC|nr:tRNA (5-methylaminomethyl-2-thiouridine)(34)-methyltransferase MnmD [Bacteroidales bacterium]MDD4215106.1 tRNA (5-methylaminomethyl-2-thiouridine)(34)-methyltransferase MnmD [Bacteroidales bacterium]